jgi:hypothetical protein
MGKPGRKAGGKRPRRGAEESFHTWEAVLFLMGIALILFLGVGTAVHALGSVCWRLKTGWLYQEGRCRVVAAQVALMDGSYVVEVEHQVEIDGRHYRRTTNTEEEQPEAGTRAEAEELLKRYEVGQLYPCWYDAADPDAHSVLLRDGLHAWEPLGRLWRSALLAAPELLLCWWLWRRRVRRQALRIR